MTLAAGGVLWASERSPDMKWFINSLGNGIGSWGIGDGLLALIAWWRGEEP